MGTPIDVVDLLLREALEQVLDDMGDHDLSVWTATKELAIAALRGEVG